MTGLPDPRHTYAVLIGVGRFADLPALPAVENNLAALKQALTSDRLWGLDPDHVIVPEDLRSPDAMRDEVQKAAELATDTLLVYYAGHGLLDDDALKLHLALAGTNKRRPETTAVPYRLIHKDVGASRAARKIVILDCCYAGRALDMAAGPGIESAMPKPSQGMYRFVATDANLTASAGTGDFTVFSGEIIRLLREGIPGGPKNISLKALFDEIRARFQENQHPEPRLVGDSNVDTVLFGPNPLWRPPDGDGTSTSPPVLSPEWLERILRDGQKGTPSLTLSVAAELAGAFRVTVTGNDGLAVETTIPQETIERALAAGTPLLEVLAWSLADRLLPKAGRAEREAVALWRPHRIGNGFAPDKGVLHEPGRRAGIRKVVRTDADSKIERRLEQGEDVVLLGPKSSGKTTTARTQASLRDTKGDGLVWLDLTDPDDGPESVLLTLLTVPGRDRHLLVVNNLQAQASKHRRHPVLDLLDPLRSELGLRVAVLATAWPRITDVLDIDNYRLTPIQAENSQVITALVREHAAQASAADREAIEELANDDIEIALVALDYYQKHRQVPDIHQVAVQLAESIGAHRLTEPRQQEMLYWFACLGAMQIDIPKSYVALWNEADRSTFEQLRERFFESNDEAWTIGNTTRASLLYDYALRTWDEGAQRFEDAGRIVHDHLMRMGRARISNTLYELRLLFPDNRRGVLEDLWYWCGLLAEELKLLSRDDPTWGGYHPNAAFASIALAAMDCEEEWAEVYAFAAQALQPESLALEAGAGTAGSALEVATRSRLPGAWSGSAGSPAGSGRERSLAELENRIGLGVLLAAEAAALRRNPVRFAQLREKVERRRLGSGALAATTQPWVTALIVSGLIRFSGRPDDLVKRAGQWLDRSAERNGPYRDGWPSGSDDAGNALSTALCVVALEDLRRVGVKSTHRKDGIRLLRQALPTLVEEGHELARTAAVTTLLHCGEDWRDFVQTLRELLWWAVDEMEEPPPEGWRGGLDPRVWVASLLLTEVPRIVTGELEAIVNQVLRWDSGPESPDTGAASSPGPKGHGEDAGSAESSHQYPGANTVVDHAAPESTAADHGDASQELLDGVLDAVEGLYRVIRENIDARRLLLRDMTDQEGIETIQPVLEYWQGLKSQLEQATRGLSAANLAAVLPTVNEIGREVFRSSWQPLQ